MTRPPALIFGVPISDVTMDETLDLFAELIDAGRGTGRSFQVATANVDFLVNALGDPRLRDVLQAADLCLADGTPVVWAARLLGMPIRERVAGSDLFPKLVERAAATGWRVHVIGSFPEVAERALAMMAERHPTARLTIDASPRIPDPTDVDPAVLDSIRAAQPDVLCVALGNPKQERFIATYREQLGVPVLIGIGGTLEMLTGERRRAPRWMQRAGLEWVVRAVQEPTRLVPRYAHDIRVFAPRFVSEWRAARRRRGRPGVHASVAAAAVTVTSDAAAGTTLLDWAAAHAALDAGAQLVLRTEAPVSDRVAGELVGLVQHARLRGRPVECADDQALREFGVDVARVAGCA